MSTKTPEPTPAPQPPKPVRGGARRPDLDTLYTVNADGSHNKIQTADVRGRFQKRKHVMWTLMIGIYLVMPWVEIGGYPAILIDLPRRHFYLFGNTFNAQDFRLAFFFVTGLAFTLFVVSALWGRLWCGYACPHTVFLEGVYRRVERWFEGDAGKRKRLNAMKWNKEKVLRRGGKWIVFMAISLVLSHTFLSYFMPVEQVFAAITSPPTENMTAFLFVVVFTLIIYFNFTWFREQLCIVICPYGRLQGVLYDQDTINVAYDHIRGEPRGHYTKTKHQLAAATKAAAASAGASVGNSAGVASDVMESEHAAPDDERRGDCIDCYRCVAVCPTGIDIRNGTQLECVGCANCIDACDEVMEKVGQSKGLIRYDSLRGIEHGERKFVRPRLFVYALLLVAGVTAFAISALARTPFEANLLRMPGSAFTVEQDRIRNGFELHLYNKQPQAEEFIIEPIPQEGVTINIAGEAGTYQLKSMEDRNVVVLVYVHRDDYVKGMEAQVRVRLNREGEDGPEEIVTMPLTGPYTRKQ